jgi:hypothetical protein
MIYTVAVSTVLQQGSSKFKANKHGVWPVILTSINGAVLPENSSILDGSVAESLGITAGNSYALLITERASQTINGKVYKNYNYAVVGGNITAALGTQMAAVAISSISNLFAPSPAQMLIAQTPTPTPTPVLTQPVVDADNEPEMSDEELAAQIKLLQAQAKARKEAAKSAA